jgi:hypothetical protein
VFGDIGKVISQHAVPPQGAEVVSSAVALARLTRMSDAAVEFDDQP